MTEATKTEATRAGAPDFDPVNAEVFKEALRRGWRDLRRAPGYALFYAGFYVLLGWLMVWITRATGQSYWLVFAAVGFPLVAPFAAAAFYDVSRRIENSEALDWNGTLTLVIRQGSGQLPWLGAVILVIFLFWFFIAHMIFALFLGLSTMTNVSSSMDIYFTAEGLQMLAFGTVVGAVFATVLFGLSVLAMPMIVDREVDFITAMLTSFAYVQANPVPMLAWGAFVAVATFVSMLPGFFGLLISLPLLGHATWHLYHMLAYGAARGQGAHKAPA